jgi:hypothetical protein
MTRNFVESFKDHRNLYCGKVDALFDVILLYRHDMAKRSEAEQLEWSNCYFQPHSRRGFGWICFGVGAVGLTLGQWSMGDLGLSC